MMKMQKKNFQVKKKNLYILIIIYIFFSKILKMSLHMKL